MPESDAPELHPREQYDALTAGTASEASTRTTSDAGDRPSAAQGAVETEVTSLTPPSADTAGSMVQGHSDDDDFNPGDELMPG